MKLQFCGVTMMPALNLSCTMARCKFEGHTYTSHLARIASSQPEKFFTRSGSLACSTGLHFQLPPTIGLRNGNSLCEATGLRLWASGFRPIVAQGRPRTCEAWCWRRLEDSHTRDSRKTVGFYRADVLRGVNPGIFSYPHIQKTDFFLVLY